MGLFNLFTKAVKTSIKNAERQQAFTQKSNENIIRQLFETMHILLQTTNYNTYISRLELFDERFEQFIIISKSPTFKSSYKAAVSKYREMYYDRNSTTLQIEKYLNQIAIFNKISFFEDTFYQLCKRLLIESQKKIKELKTEKAKENRKIVFVNNIEEALIFLRQKGYADTSNYLLKFHILIQ